jgi:hypothetical protein
VPARRGLGRPATVSLVKFSLAFSLCQFFQPGQIGTGVFDTPGGSIPDKFKVEFHPFQRWVETHQEHRVKAIKVKNKRHSLIYKISKVLSEKAGAEMSF